IAPEIILISDLTPARSTFVVGSPVPGSLVAGVFAYLLRMAILIVCLPHSFPEPAVDGTLHTFLSVLIVVFPQAVVRILSQYTPPLQPARLVVELPNSRCLVVGKLPARFDMAIQIIRFILSVEHIAEGVL